MSTPFSSTLRSLRADDSRGPLWMFAIAAALAGGWIAWSLLSRVPIYEVTSVARIEVVGGTAEVQAPVSGSVVAARLELGSQVERGEVLVELDTAELRTALAEKRAEKAALERELAALMPALAAERRALGVARRAESAALAEARAEQAEAEPETLATEDHAGRMEQLDRDLRGRPLKPFSKSELDRARAEADTRRRRLERLARSAERLKWEHETRLGDRSAALLKLGREATALDGEAERLGPAIERLELAIEQHRIRAPRSGVLGRISEMRPGSYVREGDALFTVVPEQRELEVVAEFPPAAVVGRIAPGQRAELRLDGFAWAQYGRVPARVVRLGSEAPEGRVRVELTLDGVASTRIPLQHGLTTSVDVEVERVAPALLILRAAGNLVQPAPGPTAPAAPGGGESQALARARRSF
jgi:multidrug resistance efflux pump